MVLGTFDMTTEAESVSACTRETKALAPHDPDLYKEFKEELFERYRAFSPTRLEVPYNSFVTKKEKTIGEIKILHAKLLELITQERVWKELLEVKSDTKSKKQNLAHRLRVLKHQERALAKQRKLLAQTHSVSYSNYHEEDEDEDYEDSEEEILQPKVSKRTPPKTSSRDDTFDSDSEEMEVHHKYNNEKHRRMFVEPDLPNYSNSFQ